RPNISRFSRPVSSSSTAANCPVRASSSRTSADSATTSWPSSSARPVSGSSSVARIRTSVVLPAPFGPSRPKTMPSGTSRSTPARAVVDPNRLTTPSTRTAEGVLTARSCVVLRREEIAHREAPVRAPTVRKLDELVLGRNVVEAVDALNRAPQRDVAGEVDVGAVECDEQEPVRGPRPDARHFRQSGFDLVVGHAGEALVAQASVRESLRKRTYRRALPRGEPGRTKHLGIGRQRLGRCRQPSTESLLQVRDDRAPERRIGLAQKLP